jgi:hypothetical protein
MKSKLFFTIGFALSLLCAACSDSSNSVDANGVTGAVNDDDQTEDTTTTQSPNAETENGASFETKGSGFGGSFDDEVVILDSYKSGAIMDESYGRAYDVPSIVPGEFVEEVDYDVLPHDGDGDGYNGRTYGLLTASEWNDIDNWSSWADILKGEFSNKTKYWKFYPTTLAAVKVVDKNGTGLANVSVKLLKGDNVEFATRTDNTGLAYCWVNLFDSNNEKSINEKDYSLKVNGKVSEEAVKFTHIGDESLKVNKIKSDAKQAEAKADVAFIVDATGSMGDEISFLQSDLSYIIDHAHSETQVALRTAVVFYRDESDEYLIQGKDFSTDVANTQAFIAEQHASGGGDYPEAVHSALEASLQNFSWNESARARIAFLILDAPAHHQDSIIESLQSSITLYAQNGIKLIPVAASGVDKDTESMLRFFEIITGGTYVFLTNDSGIGNSHIDASVGEHDVEKLADLMIRLIKKYVE